MSQHWRTLPKEQPSIKKLSSQLDERLQSSTSYLDMKMMLNPEVTTLPTLKIRTITSFHKEVNVAISYTTFTG